MMDKPPLVIDTCALSDKDFQKWLVGYGGRKRISSITYAEFRIPFVETKNLQLFENLLRNLCIDVENYTINHAKYTSELMSGRKNRCSECNKIKDWNDCMIASHAESPTVLMVTNNICDFPDLDGRVKTTKQIMSELHSSTSR